MKTAILSSENNATLKTLVRSAKKIGIKARIVSDEELEVVKNYMAGEFVGSLNTPFEIADRYKVILLDGMSPDFLTTYIQKIRSVTPADVMEMTTHYLTAEYLREVVVGGK